MKRPAMSDLLAHLDKKSYNRYIVIFDDLKRFARDVEFHWKLRAALKSRNATPKCLNYNFDDSPEGEFIETILAAQGELERKQNRRQVVQKQKARLERGYWPFYPPPGYTQIKHPIHGKILKPTEPKASIIIEALEGFASGRFQEQIDVFNFLKKKNYAKKPTLETVKRLLNRVVYAGYIERPDWEVSRRKGYHKPLISLITYEKIQERLNGKVNAHTRRDIREDFPLRGFVLCSKCRELYTASWSRGRNDKFPYYRCKKNECEERNKSVRKEKIEAEFEDVLRQKQPAEITLNFAKALVLRCWNKKVVQLEQVYRNRRKELEKIEAEIRDLSQRACKTKSERMIQIYENQIEKLGNKELLLREKAEDNAPPKVDFETALNEVFSFLKNPYFTWVNGNIDDKRLVLKLVFEEQLAYKRKNGFETAHSSLPLRVIELSAGSNSQAVEMVMKSWNRIEKYIWDAYELLKESNLVDYRKAA